MAGSDKTSFVTHRRARATQARRRSAVRLTLKQKSYLEDVVVALALAVILWTLFLVGGLMQP